MHSVVWSVYTFLGFFGSDAESCHALFAWLSCARHVSPLVWRQIGLETCRRCFHWGLISISRKPKNLLTRMCLVPRYIMLHHYHMTWCHEVIICGIKIGTCYQSQFGSFDSGILRDVFSGLRAESSGCANRTRLWIVSSHTWQSRFKSTFDLERQRIPRLSTIFPQSFLLAKTACCLTQGATIRIESGKDMLCLEPTYGSCRIAFDFGHRVQTKAQEHWQHRSVAHTLHTLSLSFSLVLGASKLDVMHTWLSRTQVWACVSHISFFLQGFSFQRKDPVRNREKQEIVEGCTHAMREIRRINRNMATSSS